MDVREFMPLVKKIAAEMVRSLPPSVQLDDLVQDGSVGLINAFRDHDADSGVPFHFYAASRIRWAIQDGLRANDWAARSVRKGRCAAHEQSSYYGKYFIPTLPTKCCSGATPSEKNIKYSDAT